MTAASKPRNAVYPTLPNDTAGGQKVKPVRLAAQGRPFLLRIETAHTEVLGIDREAEVHRAIGRITPGGDKLQKAIGKAFTKRPMVQWSAVLHEIADGAKVLVEIDAEGGAA